MPEINDHDLLIELRTEMKAVRQDIKEIKDGTTDRLGKLEQDHVSKQDHQDHEIRIRRLEYSLAIAVGMVVLLEIALKIYFK
jgi:hypothetical protein